MGPRKLTEGVYWVGAIDWDRRLFDSLIPLPDGTSYNAYLVKGSARAALLDTVDPSRTAALMAGLEGVERLDYIISHHAEQDHSGAIPEVLRRFPGAKVLCSQKAKELLSVHLHLPGEVFRTLADGEVIDLGGKTIEVIYTPWVHWPETISTYLREDRILFSCDMFGSHLSFSGLHIDDEERVAEAAKRYYAEVMMPFRATLKKHLERLAPYDMRFIAPSHGPVYRDQGRIMRAHADWVSERVANTVIVPYATMHGSTELMVEALTGELHDNGVPSERFNLAYADTGRLAMSLVDAASVVFGSPTVLGGAHPLVISAAFLVNALRPKTRFTGLVGSFGWGGRMVEQVSSQILNLKAEHLGEVMAKGRPGGPELEAVRALARNIAGRHRDLGLV